MKSLNETDNSCMFICSCFDSFQHSECFVISLAMAVTFSLCVFQLESDLVHRSNVRVNPRIMLCRLNALRCLWNTDVSGLIDLRGGQGLIG